MNRNVRADNVEFTVKASEDLILNGSERSIIRVPANNMYSCLMQKTQRFSSLFRHYSKHHGLPRESLDFFFMSLLDPEESPESVHLQKNDVIQVRHRRDAPVMMTPRISDDEFFACMKRMLQTGANSDVVLKVGPNEEELRAHKCVLTTRCEVFRCMFPSEVKCGLAMKESENGTVMIRHHAPEMVSKLLEFIYTNRVQDLAKLNANQLIDLLSLGEQYLMRPLKDLCEIQAKDLVTNETCTKLLSAAEKYNAAFLKDACVRHIVDNMGQLIDDDGFRQEIELYPSLALILLRAQHVQPGHSLEPAAKRRRLTMQPASDDFDDYE
ncbi:Aste57867_19351 [Aphanomyces stellatus]|uniref:Aste57867_19351 protein n=1 Tax=Aphanomyces stellatus TaxID=120398 RepID=A0A485LCA7_9STRA|nr:hypothetical protein As57867_019287 [Aphanomyces stellatus]VFT96065.1 Aste57867_19351 [Aphanomyces stellatus]